jgi:hypothetical protein
LASRIADLTRRVDRLSAYLDEITIGDGTGGTSSVLEYARFVALQGRLISHIARLLRKQKQLQADDEQSFLQECINEALDEVSIILGVQL